LSSQITNSSPKASFSTYCSVMHKLNFDSILVTNNIMHGSYRHVWHKQWLSGHTQPCLIWKPKSERMLCELQWPMQIKGILTRPWKSWVVEPLNLQSHKSPGMSLHAACSKSALVQSIAQPVLSFTKSSQRIPTCLTMLIKSSQDQS